MNNTINYEEVTLQDCLDAFEMKGMTTTISDGKVISIGEEA
jgi:hypothetical protein